MKSKNYFKLFVNDIFLPILSALFLIYINCIHIKCISDNDGLGIIGKLAMLKVSLSSSLVCFVFFVFVSYYFMDKVRSCSLSECAKATCGGAAGIYLKQFCILVLLDFVFAVFYFLYNICAYFAWDIAHPEVLGHIIMCLFLYIFMISLVAILLGFLLALIFKRFGAFLTMILAVFLTSPITLYVVEGTYYKHGFDVFPFYELISLYPRGTDSFPDNHMGYSLLPDRFAAVFFFAALLLVVISIKLIRKKSVLKCSAIALCGAVCSASLIIYLLPGAHTLTDRNPNTYYIGDLNYYYDNIGKEKNEEGGFSVIKYEMDLAVKNELSAKVTMTVDSPSLDKYKFTLYHGFKVKKAENQDGDLLSFVQDGDYIEVSRGGGTASSITLTYSGYDPTYYSHYQGMSLFGNFPFFPQSGYMSVYDTERQGFYSNLLETPTEFYVTVDHPNTVYSNLDRIDRNAFHGISDSCVLMSGFLDEKNIDGVDVVYPYLDAEQFSEEGLISDVRSFLSSKQDDNVVKKIFIRPAVNTGPYAQCNYCSDGTIVCRQIRSLSMTYPKCLVANKKQSLFILYNTYVNYHSDFDNRLIYEKDVYSDDNPGLAMMLQNAIDAASEDEVLKKIEEYLNDDSDTRDYEEALSSLIQVKGDR